MNIHAPSAWWINPLGAAITADCYDANSGEPYYTWLLLNAGADPNAVVASVTYNAKYQPEMHSLTALMYASWYRNGAVAKALIDHGARIGTRSDQGRTAIFYAQNGSNTRFDMQQCINILTNPDAAPSFQPAPNSPQAVINGSPASQTTQKLTKSQWRDKLTAHYGQPARMNIIPNWQPNEFKKIMGDPDRTQTIGDHAYWYYDCSDGTIQLSLNAPDLAFGIMQGHVNDYSN